MDLNNFFINNIDIIVTIFGVILSLFVIQYVTKIVFKIITLIIILSAFIIGIQTLYDTNMIDYINNRYCEGKEFNIGRCECIAKPILLDLELKFSQEQIENLKLKKIRGNAQVIKTYITKKNEIDSCFTSRGESHHLIGDIFKNNFNKIKNVFKKSE